MKKQHDLVTSVAQVYLDYARERQELDQKLKKKTISNVQGKTGKDHQS